jgi:hypothetical protein
MLLGFMEMMGLVLLVRGDLAAKVSDKLGYVKNQTIATSKNIWAWYEQDIQKNFHAEFKNQFDDLVASSLHGFVDKQRGEFIVPNVPFTIKEEPKPEDYNLISQLAMQWFEVSQPQSAKLQGIWKESDNIVDGYLRARLIEANEQPDLECVSVTAVHLQLRYMLIKLASLKASHLPDDLARSITLKKAIEHLVQQIKDPKQQLGKNLAIQHVYNALADNAFQYVQALNVSEAVKTESDLRSALSSNISSWLAQQLSWIVRMVDPLALKSQYSIGPDQLVRGSVGLEIAGKNLPKGSKLIPGSRALASGFGDIFGRVKTNPMSLNTDNPSVQWIQQTASSCFSEKKQGMRDVLLANNKSAERVVYLNHYPVVAAETMTEDNLKAFDQSARQLIRQLSLLQGCFVDMERQSKRSGEHFSVNISVWKHVVSYLINAVLNDYKSLLIQDYVKSMDGAIRPLKNGPGAKPLTAYVGVIPGDNELMSKDRLKVDNTTDNTFRESILQIHNSRVARQVYTTTNALVSQDDDVIHQLQHNVGTMFGRWSKTAGISLDESTKNKLLNEYHREMDSVIVMMLSDQVLADLIEAITAADRPVGLIEQYKKYKIILDAINQLSSQLPEPANINKKTVNELKSAIQVLVDSKTDWPVIVSVKNNEVEINLNPAHLVYYTDAVFAQVNAVLEVLFPNMHEYQSLKNKNNWPANPEVVSAESRMGLADTLESGRSGNLDNLNIKKLELFKKVYNALFDSQSDLKRSPLFALFVRNKWKSMSTLSWAYVEDYVAYNKNSRTAIAYEIVNKYFAPSTSAANNNNADCESQWLANQVLSVSLQQAGVFARSRVVLNEINTINLATHKLRAKENNNSRTARVLDALGVNYK